MKYRDVEVGIVQLFNNNDDEDEFGGIKDNAACEIMFDYEMNLFRAKPKKYDYFELSLYVNIVLLENVKLFNRLLSSSILACNP